MKGDSIDHLPMHLSTLSSILQICVPGLLEYWSGCCGDHSFDAQRILLLACQHMECRQCPRGSAGLGTQCHLPRKRLTRHVTLRMALTQAPWSSRSFAVCPYSPAINSRRYVLYSTLPPYARHVSRVTGLRRPSWFPGLQRDDLLCPHYCLEEYSTPTQPRHSVAVSLMFCVLYSKLSPKSQPLLRPVLVIFN